MKLYVVDTDSEVYTCTDLDDALRIFYRDCLRKQAENLRSGETYPKDQILIMDTENYSFKKLL